MDEYYLELNDSEDLKWNHVKEYVISKTNFVEFNILYSDSSLQRFIDTHAESLISRGVNRKKLYSGETLRFIFSEELKRFIEPLNFNYFVNKSIEDPSFYINGIEVIATITHEDQIYIKKDIEDLAYFSERGFELESEEN